MNKKLFLLILIPALIIIGVYVFIRYSLKTTVHRGDNISMGKNQTDSASAKQSSALDLRPLFIERLKQLVAKTSDNVYDLSVGELKIDILASTASFENVVLKPDKKRADSLNRLGLAPAETFSFSFENLQVEGINFDDAITSKTMNYKLVKLTNPVFEIYRKPTDAREAKEIKEDFTQRFLKEMQKLSVQNLMITGGKVIIHNKGKSTVLKDVSINMQDILIDSATRIDPSRFLFAKKASLGFKDYKVETGNGKYTVAIDKVNVEAPGQTLTLVNFSLSSPLGKKEFSGRQTFAKEYYQVAFPSLIMKGVNWWSLLNEEEVVAKEINIPGGKVSIYLDRSKPPASRMGNFPAQLLMKLPLKISVDRLKANDLDFSYEEFNPISQQSGTILLNDVSMNIANVSNMNIKGAKPVTVNGKAMLMGKVPINAAFVFSLQKYQAGDFTAQISAKKAFDGTLINSFLMPMGMLKIERGNLQKLEANIRGNELNASGDVTILYQDLKINLLRKDNGDKDLDKKGVTSFLANTFLLKKDNPKAGNAVRTTQAEFKRIPEGGFFTLVWKTIMTGALKTIGAPAKIANKTVSGVKGQRSEVKGQKSEVKDQR